MPTEPARLSSVDGLRAIAATAVFLMHGTFPALVNPVGRQFADLDLGVEIFFVLSGFLVYRPFVVAHLAGAPMPGLRAYFTRRALRIYPAYWIAFVLLTLTHSIRTLGAADFWRHFFLVHEYFDFESDRGLPVSWTLVVEVSFYAFLPLWAALMRGLATRLGAWRVEVGGAMVLIATGYPLLRLWHIDREHLQAVVRVLPPAFPTLGAGMLLAVISVGGQQGRPLARRALQITSRAGWWWIVALALFWWMSTPPVFRVLFSPRLLWREDVFQSIIAVLLVAPVVLAPDRGGFVRSLLRQRAFVFVGTVSYGVYLWHSAILENIAAPHVGTAGVAVTVVWLVIAYALTVLVASASFFVLERPVTEWARARFTHRSLVPRTRRGTRRAR